MSVRMPAAMPSGKAVAARIAWFNIWRFPAEECAKVTGDALSRLRAPIQAVDGQHVRPAGRRVQPVDGARAERDGEARTEYE